MKKTHTLLFLANVDWFMISHRLVIAQAAASAGWKVYVACENTGRAKEICVDGIEYIPLKLSRSGTNPLEDYRTYREISRIYKRIKPDVVHQITIKPVVYGGLAAKKYEIKGIVNAISGLGYAFTGDRVGLLQRLILRLMRYGFSRPNVAVIFQNQDDRKILEASCVLNSSTQVHLIKGSGIDLNVYALAPLPQSVPVRVLLPCRMLWDKGVREVREASDRLREKYKDKLQFVLVGMADNENKSGVPEDYLSEWADGDYVIWEGHQSDMLAFYRGCHIVVLPSYREGLPKALIEACAVGRPIVTTDAIGCKDCVDEGVNGLKVPVGDAEALAQAIEKIISDPALMEEMGKAGRKKAEAEFDVDDVVKLHLEIYNSLLSK